MAEKEKKKGKGKKALKIIIIIVAVLVLAYLVCTLINIAGDKGNEKLAASVEPVKYDSQLIPEKDDDGDWCFTADRDFKTVQLTDIHIGAGFLSFAKDSSAITTVATMLKAEKPDLVIITGDIAYPIPFQSGTINNLRGAKIFAALMEQLGVYWTLGYGNHDTEAYSMFTREQITDFYLNYPHCLLLAGPEDIDGVGNQIIKIKNSDGIITQAMVILDSHSYTDGDYFGAQWKYDNIHENQITWYKNRIEAMNEQNTSAIKALGKEKTKEYKDLETVKSLLFFHIPLTEYKDAWNELAENNFEDTEDVKYVTGLVGETGKQIYCGIKDDNLFETILELGSTKAVFCGHDHFNYFTVNYKGIDLSYGYSVDYLAYIGINKKGSQRGCTVITTTPDGEYNAEKFNLYQSGRYDIPAGFADDIGFQFESVTYQVNPEK